MFQSARLKLTAWYLAIIMVISIVFSIAIFNLLASELDQNYRRMVLRDEQIREFIPPDEAPPAIGPEVLEASEDRIKLNLLYINLVILLVSATAGYFLAGRTLKPIKNMVDEQNRFITDASHELRTPLTALKTSIEVYLRDKHSTFKDAQSLITSNLEEVNGLQVLSDSLLILAKAPGNSGILNIEEMDLKETTEEALDKVRPLAKHKHILLETDLSNIVLQADKQEIIRLLIIFLDNAIKYSPEGSTVKIKTLRDANYAKLIIKDHGIGIVEEDLPHIFDRFYRVDKSRSQVTGYGLGLSIARKIIQEHHGAVDVESKVSKGTTFSISLPLKQPKSIL